MSGTRGNFMEEIMNVICNRARRCCVSDGCHHATPHDPCRECAQLKCNGTESKINGGSRVACIETLQAKKIGVAIVVSLLLLVCMSCQSPVLGSDGKPKDAKNLQHDEHTVPVVIVVE